MDADVLADRTVAALRQPGFSHLLGVGIAVDGEVRVVGAVDRRTDVFSVTKAVVGRAVREAVRRGVLDGATSTVSVVAGRRAVTVARLLSMTQAWVADPDMDDLERLPGDPLPTIVGALIDGPGPARYVNAGYHLLARELQAATGAAAALLHETVLAPAGLTAVRWEADVTGTPWGHAHLHLTVRELLELGRHWCDRPDELPPATAPRMAPEFLPYGAGLWWSGDTAMAAGWGGQCLLIDPSRRLVLATLGATGWDRTTNTDDLPADWRSGRELFRRHLLGDP